VDGYRAFDDVPWHDWRPQQRATLVFVVDQERILLIRKKRGLGAGKINGPGGRIDPGETALECAIRETREEIGIVPLATRECGQHAFQFVDGLSLHVYVFKASDFRGRPIETEEAAPIWFGLDEIPYDDMWEDDRFWLPLVLQDRRFFGRWLFDEDRLMDYRLQKL
jgi:8-oxo-dGTP diphosphatase